MSAPAIAIVGSIASGKTTLMHALSAALSLPAFAEEIDDNPFLPLLSEEPARWCLPNQLWFLLESHRSRVASVGEAGGVADHSPEEVAAIHSPVFRASGWLTDEEASLVSASHRQLFSGVRKPDLFVALSAPHDVLIGRVRGRGRPQDVVPTVEYLTAVSDRRERYLESVGVPVCWIDSHLLDFRSGVDRQKACDLVIAALS